MPQQRRPSPLLPPSEPQKVMAHGEGSPQLIRMARQAYSVKDGPSDTFVPHCLGV